MKAFISRLSRMLPVVGIILVISFSVIGCASTQLSEPENDRVSLVVGYLDMSEAPTNLSWMEIKQLKPSTKKPFYGCGVEDGLFYNSYLEPGVYKFTEFGGASTNILELGAQYTYQFPSQGKGELDIQIDEPGIYFVGSYKYEKVKSGFFEPGSFDLKSTQTPTEREVLTMMLAKAETTEWYGRIMRRLNELGGPAKLEEE